MTTETNKALTRQFMERAFNEGDLTIIDEALAPEGIDHQEPLGTNFATHLKAVITMLRSAFPDLHFEIHDMLAEGELVAFRSTMTGTHRGPFQGLPPTGKQISVAHMHFVRYVDGKTSDLWHVWDIAGLMRQLGTAAAPRPQAV
jgi:steroid delta-isomerase-like uncharacterized protein